MIVRIGVRPLVSTPSLRRKRLIWVSRVRSSGDQLRIRPRRVSRSRVTGCVALSRSSWRFRVSTSVSSIARDAPVSVGPISLAPLLNAATVASREVELTDVETRILHELLLNATHPVTRERLTRRGLMRNWSPDDRTLDTHINRLRRKLGVDTRGRTPIRTITGVGYLLLADWKPA